MQEPLLLPQWAESLQMQRNQQFQELKAAFVRLADSICSVVDAFAQAVRLLLDAFENAFRTNKPPLLVLASPCIEAKRGEVLEEDQPKARAFKNMQSYVDKYPPWPRMVDGTIEELKPWA